MAMNSPGASPTMTSRWSVPTCTSDTNLVRALLKKVSGRRTVTLPWGASNKERATLDQKRLDGMGLVGDSEYLGFAAGPCVPQVDTPIISRSQHQVLGATEELDICHVAGVAGSPTA